MKNLVRGSINEISLKGTHLNRMGTGMKGIIKKWLDAHGTYIEAYTINDDLTIDIDDDDFNNEFSIFHFDDIPNFIKFNTITMDNGEKIRINWNTLKCSLYMSYDDWDSPRQAIRDIEYWAEGNNAPLHNDIANILEKFGYEIIPFSIDISDEDENGTNATFNIKPKLN